MPRRLVLVIGALIAVPLVAFGVTRVFLDSPAGEPAAATLRSTTTTSSTSTSTTQAPATTSPTTTTAAGAGSSAKSTLPSVPRAGEPVPAATATGLAAQIRSAEAAIRDPNTPAGELTKQSHVQQVAYRALVNEPGRKDATFALLDAEVRAIAEANVTAGAKLRSMIKTPKESLPPWRIVPPAPAPELLGYYREAETTIGVPWQYLAAINLVETRMGRIRGNSEANAQGPMQFLPATFAQYGNGGDIQSNRDSILAAARLLKRNGITEDLRKAIWNYNHDYRYVDAVIAYADRMKADERAYFGYHQWQVYYVTVAGDVWLYEGWVGPGA